jgi:hypothetical protein
MAGVYDAIRIFALEHRGCGELRYDASRSRPWATRSGWRAAVGRELTRGVSPADAEADLFRSTLMAFEN